VVELQDMSVDDKLVQDVDDFDSAGDDNLSVAAFSAVAGRWWYIPQVEAVMKKWGKKSVKQRIFWLVFAFLRLPLTLTCITFQARSDEAPLVLISADLGWWKSRDDEAFVRGGVLEALSLDAARCKFCLTHTHAGPSINREDAAKPGGEHIAPYLDQLRSAAARAAKEALAAAVPATLVWRYGRCDLATNRDLRDPQRERCIVGFNPGHEADDTAAIVIRRAVRKIR
jgi:hypothetical protein